MHVLVTGGAGFIGSHVVEQLLALDHKVTVVDDLSHPADLNQPQSDTHILSVLDPRLKLLFKGVDAVVHTAAQTSAPSSANDPFHDAEINIFGTINTFRSAMLMGVKRFIYLSSAAVYASKGTPPFREDHPISPSSPYGLSKWVGEEYVRVLSGQTDMDWVILRLANVYGPRQSAAGEAGVIARWVHALTAGYPITVQGDGRQSRDFVYVGDVAEAVVKALQLPPVGGCTLNVGTGVDTAIRDLIPLLEDLTGRQAALLHAPSHHGEIRHSALDSQQAKEILQWKPATLLREGLARTVAWADGRTGPGHPHVKEGMP